MNVSVLSNETKSIKQKPSIFIRPYIIIKATVNYPAKIGSNAIFKDVCAFNKERLFLFIVIGSEYITLEL